MRRKKKLVSYFCPETVLPFFLIVVAVHAQPTMQLVLETGGSPDAPVVARVKGSGLDGMYAARCTLYVDTSILQATGATVTSGMSKLQVSGGYGSSNDTIVFTSTKLDSSDNISTASLVQFRFPIQSSMADYSSSVQIVGGSVERMSGETVQVEINSSSIRKTHQYLIPSYYGNVTKTRSPKIYDIRGRCLGSASSPEGITIKSGSFLDPRDRSAIARQILIRR